MVQAMPGYRMVDSLTGSYERDSLSAEYQYYQWEYHRLDSTYKADSILVVQGKKQKALLDMVGADRQKMAINIVYWQQIAQNKSDAKRRQLAVDFGIMCVGEVAEKKMSVGNKGKYKISYKFVFTRPGLSKLLKIFPMEGVIEAGGKDLANISLTFCSHESIHLIGNKHISLQLLEPITNELVESFPISVSTQTKYNTTRR